MKSGDTFAQKAIKFFTSLNSAHDLPDGITILNPYNNRKVKDITTKFYELFLMTIKKELL